MCRAYNNSAVVGARCGSANALPWKLKEFEGLGTEVGAKDLLMNAAALCCQPAERRVSL